MRPRTSSENLRILQSLRPSHDPSHRKARARVKAEINVTPLVDVVLVLLIIFMVVTPLIANGVAVDLPRTLHHAKKPDDGKDIIVSITWDKRIYLGARSVLGADDVARLVVDEKRKFPEKTVFVKGDARTPYGSVREVMEALQSAHIEDVILGTEELILKP